MNEQMNSDRFLVAVLKAAHNISAFEDRAQDAGIDLAIPHVDLLEAVLDELGVPAHSDDYNQPDETTSVPEEQASNVYCRDWVYDLFDEIVTSGSEEECLKFINAIRDDIKQRRLL